jgi:hypothetical protein
MLSQVSCSNGLSDSSRTRAAKRIEDATWLRYCYSLTVKKNSFSTSAKREAGIGFAGAALRLSSATHDARAVFPMDPWAPAALFAYGSNGPVYSHGPLDPFQFARVTGRTARVLKIFRRSKKFSEDCRNLERTFFPREKLEVSLIHQSNLSVAMAVVTPRSTFSPGRLVFNSATSHGVFCLCLYYE